MQNEIFEKIMEEIETYTIEVEAFGLLEDYISVDLVKEITRRHMKHMGNWNDISEKELPPLGKPLIVTIKDNLQGGANELRFPVYCEKHDMKEGYRWSWRYGDFAYELLPDVSEVIAWQPLPEPYRKKGEKE